MIRFLVVLSEGNWGRGARGGNLGSFLSSYHGRRCVEICGVRELEQGPSRQADVVFVGLPTTLQPHHLLKLRYRQLVLFDYGDRADPAWETSDVAFLRSLTDLYLKPCVEEDWDFGLRPGVLPIRRYPGLAWSVWALRGLCPRRYPDICRRDHDVSFLGNCTSYRGTSPEHRYYQRIEWMRELRQNQRGFSFWGGLQASANNRERLLPEFGDLGDILFAGGRQFFPAYFQHLLRSRVVLTPTGNGRWSYRHYEAIYAGALLVSTDFRRVRTLIPLPLDGMVHVPDHTPVVPAIEMALEMCLQQPDLTRQNIEFLETYLHNGTYDRRKPQLMDEFLAQLN